MMKNKKILLTGMALLPTLSLCSCQVSNYQKNNIKEVSKKYSLSDGQIINSKYSSLDAVRSMSDDTDVTQDQLNHRIAAIEDKTQYTLYAVGLDKTTVDTTIGLMEKNISNKITEELASNNLPADGQLTQDSLNNVYSYVNSQAAEFGVDVIDYDRFQYDIPTMAAKYEIDLINAGVDKDVAIEQATQYKSDILDTLDAANESLYDDVTYSLLLNEFQTNENLTLNYLKNNKINVDEKQKNDKDAELETVLTWFTNNSSQLLSIREEGLSLLKDYSLNNEGLEVGSILTSDDVTALFNYKYNLARGCDFDQISIDHDIPEAKETGDYDKNTINRAFYEAPLDSFVGYVPYEKNEIFPGYQLHVKLLDVENSVDSHVANLKFVFGISKTDSTEILWQNLDGTNVESMNVFSCKVNSFDLINNITNNKYLNDKLSDSTATLNEKISFTELSNDVVPDENGVFFKDSALSRTKINEILNNYKGSKDQDYDLSKNPVILDAAAYEGIPIPSNIEELLSTSFHTNQKLALIASDVNTNTNTLSVHWALIDSGIESNETTNNDFYVVKDIPWHWNNIELASLEVQFDIDQVIQQTIDLGRTEALFISNYSEYIQIMASLNQNSSSGDTSKIDEIGKNLDKCIGFLSASSALGASVGAMMVVYSCRVVASLGADSDAIANIVIGSVYLATLGSEVILSGIDFHKSYKNYKNMKKNSTIENKYSSFKSTIVNNFKNLEKDIKTLNDSHAQYDAKVKAGQNVHKLSLETRILTKSLLETYISENKDEIENVVGKDKFDEIHNTLYQDVDTSKDDEDSLSKLQIASYALLGISFPLLILTSVAYCVPAFNRLSFDKAYEAGIAEQDQFAAWINGIQVCKAKSLAKGYTDLVETYDFQIQHLTNNAGRRYAELHLGEKRLEYNAHKALNNSTKIAEYKYPVIITVMSVFQFAAQALLDCILPN